MRAEEEHRQEFRRRCQQMLTEERRRRKKRQTWKEDGSLKSFVLGLRCTACITITAQQIIMQHTAAFRKVYTGSKGAKS